MNTIFKLKKCILCVLILLFACFSCKQRQKPELSLSRYIVDLGYVDRDSIYEDSVYIYNRGRKEMHISSVMPDCECITPTSFKQVVPAGDSCLLNFTLNTKNKEGAIENLIIIEANTDSAIHFVQIHANIK